MINWKLHEILARHRITVRSLAKKLDCGQPALSRLKNAKTLPAIGGDRICKIAEALSELSGVNISPLDLLEFEADKRTTTH